MKIAAEANATTHQRQKHSRYANLLFNMTDARYSLSVYLRFGNTEDAFPRIM